jgi:tRNA uridine 5-carboxymethylaminomethyl modification enzyme
LNECRKTKNLTLLIDEVEDITMKNSKVCGVRTRENGLINTNFVVVTSGTYMRSIVHIGLNSKPSGPVFDNIVGKKQETI